MRDFRLPRFHKWNLAMTKSASKILYCRLLHSANTPFIMTQ
ncbi:hypothetical protein [Helicobacter rodentium]|nr:hypothetical protein [Helicobacter rodentium]